jgi:F-type H+-transporting ATPase subunit epsilon
MYKRGGQTYAMVVSGGFAEVIDNVMTVLTDSTELAREIDVERARTALRKAEDLLKTLSPIDPAFPETQAAFQRAQARLEMASDGRHS